MTWCGRPFDHHLFHLCTVPLLLDSEPQCKKGEFSWTLFCSFNYSSPLPYPCSAPTTAYTSCTTTSISTTYWITRYDLPHLLCYVLPLTSTLSTPKGPSTLPLLHSSLCLPGPSNEEQAFRRYYAQLREKVNPSDIAAHLYSEGLISRNERDDADNKMHSDGVRMDKLLPAVERAIEIDKKNFYTFLDILDLVPKYKCLVQSMRSTLPAPPQSP